MVSATRTVRPLLPAQISTRDGLAFTLWLPPNHRPPAQSGIVVLHGADSVKESHHDFARAAVALGLGAICFDARGHGESAGRLDGRAVADVAAMAAQLREALGDPRAPVALRGSSMGGYFALLAAGPARADAIVAICPAEGAGLRRGLLAARFEFAADVPELLALLERCDLRETVRRIEVPVLLLHAEGDERVPVGHSRQLAEVMSAPGSRIIVVPGGHHRSIQHDSELQAVSLRFIERALRAAAGRRQPR
jgi:pimeloyl-ACP methyl ester carboxylesterase